MRASGGCLSKVAGVCFCFEASGKICFYLFKKNNSIANRSDTKTMTAPQPSERSRRAKQWWRWTVS